MWRWRVLIPRPSQQIRAEPMPSRNAAHQSSGTRLGPITNRDLAAIRAATVITMPASATPSATRLLSDSAVSLTSPPYVGMGWSAVVAFLLFGLGIILYTTRYLL